MCDSTRAGDEAFQRDPSRPGPGLVTMRRSEQISPQPISKLSHFSAELLRGIAARGVQFAGAIEFHRLSGAAGFI